LSKKSFEISGKFVVWESRRCMWRAERQTDGWTIWHVEVNSLFCARA